MFARLIAELLRAEMQEPDIGMKDEVAIGTQHLLTEHFLAALRLKDDYSVEPMSTTQLDVISLTLLRSKNSCDAVRALMAPRAGTLHVRSSM